MGQSCRTPPAQSEGTNGNGSLHDMVVSRVRDMIVEGELAGGTRVPERSICEQLGISRTPLREAYKVLASEGLLTLNPHRGATVTRFTLQDVEDAMQVLSNLEALAAELFCARATEDDVARIETLQKRMVSHFKAGELLEYFKTNQAIHRAILAGSGNKLIPQIYQSVDGRIRRFRYAGNLKHSRWDRAVQEHEQMLMAIQDRDGPLLAQIVRSHLNNGWQVVREMFRDELAIRAAAAPRQRRRRKAVSSENAS